MTPDSLLGPLNDLPPRAVTAHLRELAHTLPEDARVSLTAELLGGSHRARELGVQFALLAGDTAAILGALRQGSPLIRESAASALARVPMPAPADFRAAYAGASTRERRRLVRGAVTHGRGDIVAVLLPVARELGHVDDAARLVRAAHYRDLAAHAADLLPAIDDARFLAVRAPELLLAEARALITDPVSARDYAQRRAVALAALVRAHPALAGEVLALVAVTPLDGWYSEAHAALWNALLIAHPDAVAAYRRAGAVPVLSRAAARALVARGGDAVVALLGDPRPGVIDVLLRAGDPAPLRRLLARVAGARQSTPLRDRLLAEDVRIAEAEAEIARFGDAAPVTLTARLGWPRARATLLPVARGRDVAARAEAAAAAIASTAFDPSGAQLADALDELPGLRTEADPVRFGVLTALAQVPAPAVAKLPVARLEALRADVLGARDVPGPTLRALLDVVLRLVRTDRRDWALETLAATDTCGWLVNTAGLTGPDAAEVADALLRGGSLAPHLIVAEFGLTPAIDAHIGAVLTAESAGEDDDELAAIWLRPAATRLHRARTLLADPSALHVPRVDALVRGPLADLLDPTLFGTEIEGRFAPYPTRWLPHITRVQTWTDAQRQSAAATLAGLLAEDSDDEDALAALAAIPEYRHRPLAALLGDPAQPDERVIAAGAAPTPVLAAALRTDAAATAGSAAIRRAARTRAEDVPLLVDALVAGPAAASAAATPVAPNLPAPKLTAAKALLRVAEHAPRALIPALRAQILAAVGDHADVHLAAVRIAFAHPAEVSALADLDADALLVRDPDATRVLLALRPGSLDPQTRVRIAGLLGGLLAAENTEVAQIAARVAVRWLGAYPEVAEALWTQVATPGRDEPDSEAWTALLTSAGVEALPGAVRALIEAGAPGHDRLREFETNAVFGAAPELSDAAVDAVLAAADLLAEAGFRAGAMAVLLRLGGAVSVDPARLSVAVRGALGERASVAASVLTPRLSEYPGPDAAAAARLSTLAQALQRTGTAESILALEIARLIRVSDPLGQTARALFDAGLASANAEVAEYALRFDVTHPGTFGWFAYAPLAGTLYQP